MRPTTDERVAQIPRRGRRLTHHRYPDDRPHRNLREGPQCLRGLPRRRRSDRAGGWHCSGRLPQRSLPSSCTTSSSPSRATRSRSANPRSGSASSCCCSSASSSGSSRPSSGRGPKRPGPRARGPRPFQVSRALATRKGTGTVLPAIADILRTEARMDRVWIALGPDGSERVAADTDTTSPQRALGPVVLRRMPGMTRRSGSGSTCRQDSRARRAAATSRPIECGSTPRGRAGSVWALRGAAPACPTLPKPGSSPPPPIRPARPSRSTTSRRRPRRRRSLAERRAEVGAPPVGVARSADAAGDDPRRGRDARGRAAGCRPRTRPRAPTRSIARSSTSTAS